MANFIHVRDSDNRVVGVFSESKTPVTGVTEYNEEHPDFLPHWGYRIWTRTGVDTYVDSGVNRILRLDTYHRILCSVSDTTPDRLTAKLAVEEGKLTHTLLNPGGNEVCELSIGADVFDKTVDTSDNITESSSKLFLTTGAQNITGDKIFDDKVKILTTTSEDNLHLEKSTSSTHWLINAGRTGFFDNWLLFKNSGEGGNYTFAISNTGQFKGKDGSSGAPTYTFDNASNYGLSYSAASSGHLRLSTGGISRLEIEDDGTLNVLGTTDYENLVTHDDDVPNKKYVDDKVGTVSTDLPAVSARRTTTYATTTTWADVNFDTADLENDAAVVDHEAGTTDRITMKVAGLYRVSYRARVAAPTIAANYTIEGRVRVNDTTVLNGSQSQDTVFNDSSIPGDVHRGFISSSFERTFSANDFVSFQSQRVNHSGTEAIPLEAGATFSVVRLRGTKGDAGPTGSGSNITLKDEGSNVTGTPHATLDFVGSGVTVTDAGSGQATVTIPGGTFGSNAENAESDTESTTTSETFQTKLSHTTASVPAGTYRLGWRYEVTNSSSSYESQVEIAEGGTVYGLTNYEPDQGNSFIAQAGFKYITYGSAGTRTFTIKYKTSDDEGTAKIRRVRLEFWRVS
jgi:hypothetical protein